MPKAIEVAQELRKWADKLDTIPELEVDRPYICLRTDGYGKDPKALFAACVASMPRPLVKELNKDEIRVVYRTSAITITCSVMQSTICELVEHAKPAVYRCVPLLSFEEEQQIA